MKERQYIAIDLKSFYASVECMQRGLDPLKTNLVVADAGKTEKTICLAVSPSLKSFGIPGRPRLFEVVEKVSRINARRGAHSGQSCNLDELKSNPSLAVDYIVAPPQMSLYMNISTQIYGVYLKYIAPEDIHIYSIDEVFIDVTAYLKTYNCTARRLAVRMIRDVLATTGITATAGIGSNLFLCKVAMDILAKKATPDSDGVRLAELTKQSYRERLWSHTPLTDFWRIGRGYATKLEKYGLLTMGDIARCSLENEELLYKLFGVNAELLIDHAWGEEPTLISDIQAYTPEENSLGQGQVLTKPYPQPSARLIVREMTDLLALDLLRKGLVTDKVVLHIGYDICDITPSYHGEIALDRYGRQTPPHSHGTEGICFATNSTRLITEAMLRLFDRIFTPGLHMRRLTLTMCNVMSEGDAAELEKLRGKQLTLFESPAAEAAKDKAQKDALARERARNKAIIELQDRFGKNAVLKGMNLRKDATTRERNTLVGGHRAGEEQKK